MYFVSIDTLRYSYNIRGWLRGINKDYARNENSAVNWFGMELAYDFGFNAKQFNGNIAGIRWRSKGDGEERAYGFAYDNVNRLLRAEFTQNNGGWNTTAKVDFTMKMGNGTSPYSAYDANGNILGMIQRGLKLNASPAIDSLRYGYNATSNKLNYVTDIANDVNTKLGDFKEINNNTSQDYTYDGNGNMIVDNNKAIASITYNHLNLPNVVTITGKGTITYTYDAAGNKLKKETVDNTVVPSKTTTTLYAGANIYQNDTLQLLIHEEGRVRPLRPGFTDTMYYDYFEKDHLGNVRTVLTDELKQDIYPAATLEGTYADGNTAVGYEKNFYTIDNTKIVDKTTATGITDYENNNGIPSPYPAGNSGNANYSNNSQKLYRLQATAATNGGVNGLGVTLKVMSGDKIDIMCKSYYFTNNTGGNNYNLPVGDIVAGLLGATNGTAALKGFTATDLNGQSSITNAISNFLGDAGRGTGTVPKAYINYILFDENFKYVTGNFSRVGTQNVVKSHYGDAAMQNILVNKNGYLYVYVSNESPVAVFFDNLQVVHTRGPLLEETHYYPFGLTMKGISAKSEGKVENRISKFQGQEIDVDLDLNWYGFKWRNHDPQIGRFIQIDPISSEYEYNSPFAFSENRVTSSVEIEGLEAKDLYNELGPVREKVKRDGLPKAESEGEKVLDASMPILAQLFALPIPAAGLAIKFLRFTAKEEAAPSEVAPIAKDLPKSKAQQRADKLSEKERPGEDFTAAGKDATREVNKEKYDGTMRCENCKQEVVLPKQSKKNETPPTNEAHVDHIDPKSNMGSGTPNNGQVLCRGCNLDKGSKIPVPKPPVN